MHDSYNPCERRFKGLPGKNIKNLNGKPLLLIQLKQQLDQKISEVIVSTDDLEIAAVLKKYGAKVPFIRPDYLAGDNSSILTCTSMLWNFNERTK